MPATRYRNLEARSLIDVGARSTPTGAANASQALADSFASFSRTASDVGQVATDYAAQKFAEKGAEAGLAGKPELKTGLASVMKFGKAYNSAAMRGYAIHSDLDANNTAARLEVEAGTDPDRFSKNMTAARDAVLNEAPPEARSVVQEIYDKRMGEGLARIHGALATELRNDDRKLISENIDQKTERIAYLRSQNTPDAFAEADEEEAKLTLLVDAAVGDGTMSPTEGSIVRRGAKRDILSRTVQERFKNELNDPHGDPVGMLELVKDVVRKDSSLTPEEEQKLEDSLMGELRDRNALDAMRERHADDERKARHAAGDQKATSDLLGGALNQRQLKRMVDADQISPEVARTLNNELQAGDRNPKSDPKELAHVELNLLSIPEQDIMENQSLTWADRARMIQKRRDDVAGWKGTQVAKEAFDRIDRALNIVPGTPVRMLDEAQLRQRDTALSELYDIVDALPPQERQGAVLDASQKVISTRIKNAASEEVKRIQRNLDAYKKKVGDPTRLSTTGKKDYDRVVLGLENQLREQQSKAAGAN